MIRKFLRFIGRVMEHVVAIVVAHWLTPVILGAAAIVAASTQPDVWAAILKAFYYVVQFAPSVA